jgi:O-antigen/teichoic acid export membrane protein
LRKGVSFSFGPSSILSRQFIKDILPFALITFLMAVHYRFDAFLLERMHPIGAYEAGLYAAAYRLLDAGNMIGYLMASFLLPFIARNRNHKKDIQEVVLAGRHVLVTVCIIGITAVVFLAPWLQQILYHDKIPVTEILQWCLPALLGYALVQVYGTVMTATGHIVPFCYIMGLSVILNIVLNLFLIPEMGAKGCCIAALVSQMLCGLATMLYVKAKLQIPVHLRSWLIYIFMALVLGAFFLLGNEMLWNKWLMLAGAGVLAISIILSTRLFQINKWLNTFRANN